MSLTNSPSYRTPLKAWRSAWTRLRQHNLWQSGIAVMLLAALLQATMTAITKHLGHSYPSTQMIFFRSAVGIFLIGLSVLARPVRQVGGLPRTLLVRGFFGGMSLVAFFYCITRLELAFANTYNLTYPIFMGLILGLFYRRALHRLQWLAIAGGFMGIWLIFRPDLAVDWTYHLFGLFTGVCTAAGYLAINRLSGLYDHRIVVLSFLSFSLVLVLLGMVAGHWLSGESWAFITAPFLWPDRVGWFWLILLGVVAYLGQLMITRAYSLEDPAVVGTINFMQIPFALGWGLLLGDHLPDIWGFSGILIIVASGVFITWWTRRKTNYAAG